MYREATASAGLNSKVQPRSRGRRRNRALPITGFGNHNSKAPGSVGWLCRASSGMKCDMGETGVTDQNGNLQPLLLIPRQSEFITQNAEPLHSELRFRGPHFHSRHLFKERNHGGVVQLAFPLRFGSAVNLL